MRKSNFLTKTAAVAATAAALAGGAIMSTATEASATASAVVIFHKGHVICGGMLITHRQVLTAVNCVEGKEAKDLRLRLPNGVIVPVFSVVHDVSRPNGDIALLFFK